MFAWIGVIASLALATVARADVTLPIDVSTASTTLASYIGPAAGFALVVAVAFLGCMIVWRVFKRIAKG